MMQRGVGNVNSMKMAKCIMELERIKGIKQGGYRGNQYIKNQNKKYNQSDLAEDLHISQQQLQDYKKLLKLIPEFQQMIENGSMKATVGYKIWAKMSSEEQEKFFNDIGREKIKTLTQKATKEYIGQKVKVCEGEGCNKRILVKNNKNKYCKECAKEQKRLNNKENMRKYRDVVK